MKRFLLLLLIALPAFARTLHWDELAVRAHLDARGNLHIREQQTIVFNGEWNGGERIFRLEPGQKLEFHGISRVDEERGLIVPLTRGGLGSLHHYDFTDHKTLRWRSRMPEDPPFRNERRTYVLEYTLSNILLRRGRDYRLDHDFAFPGRSGLIRRFTLDLVLDPAWKSPGLRRHIEAGLVPPEEGVVVRADLEYTGSGAPAAQKDTLPLRLVLAMLLIVAPVLLWRRMREHEQSVGRLAPLSATPVSPRWIDEHLLQIPAEVIGTAWDEEATANEVSALLARWAGEEKITTAPSGESDLQMTLDVPRETFDGYERKLIDRLFFDGNETSTTAIREYYRSNGFNPSEIIKPHLLAKANALSHMDDPLEHPSRVQSVLLVIATAIFLAMAFLTVGPSVVTMAGMWIIGVLWAIGASRARVWRSRVDRGINETLGVRVSIAAIIFVGLLALFVDSMWPARLASFSLALLAVHNIINSARSKRGPAAIAFRKKLAAVREYFIDELQKATPAMEDRWFPYVIAFGLNDQATAWMQTFGTESSSFSSISSSSSSTSSTGSGSTAGWTGGGGAFGGAGASGSWTAAAAGLAAGVASPSSSGGSSGGGGGGGSSSGGGGGGGW